MMYNTHTCSLETQCHQVCLSNFVSSSGKSPRKFEFQKDFFHIVSNSRTKDIQSILIVFLMRAQWMHVQLLLNKRVNQTMMLGIFEMPNHPPIDGVIPFHIDDVIFF